MDNCRYLTFSPIQPPLDFFFFFFCPRKVINVTYSLVPLHKDKSKYSLLGC